jgi:hypothetical protein
MATKKRPKAEGRVAAAPLVRLAPYTSMISRSLFNMTYVGVTVSTVLAVLLVTKHYVALR